MELTTKFTIAQANDIFQVSNTKIADTKVNFDLLFLNAEITSQTQRIFIKIKIANVIILKIILLIN